MKQISTAATLALLAILTLGAANATAVTPLFLTESKKALLFLADGLGVVTLRGGRAGQVGTITCQKSSIHGFILDKSPLAHELHVELSGKCEQEVVGSKGTCTEPLKFQLSYGELGLLNGHVYLLVAPEKGTEFLEYTCTNGNTKLIGAVLGEFKLFGRDGLSQYLKFRLDYLLLFKAKGTTQEPEEVELLGVVMKGVSLAFEGFLGEKGSLESAHLLLFDGETLIDP